jgi:hypothetical protein
MRQNDFTASVRRTTVVNVDEENHRLPPDHGPFKEFKVADWFCPDEWSKDGVFISIKEGDPMWFDFRGNDDCAILCAIQRLNPVTGDPANLEGGLSKDPKQNYLRMPQQQWLDGYAKDGKVYQFIVTKAGEGLAVSEFVLPKHMQDSHAVGFAFFGPKNPKPKPVYLPRSMSSPTLYSCSSIPMGNYDQITKGDSVKIGARMKNLCSSGGKKGGMSAGGFANDSLDDCGADAAIDFDAASIDCFAAPADSSGDCVYSEGEVEVKTSSYVAIPDVETEVNYSKDDVKVQEKIPEHLMEVVEAEVVDRLEEVDHTQFDKASMGMGGRISQLITTDDNTVEYYTEKPAAVLTIYFCLPEQFEAIMKQGERQDAQKQDKFVHSGEVGGVQVPLVKSAKQD